MDGSRLTRHFRIAVTALSLTACVLMIALWVRSYWWHDIAHCPLTSTPRMLCVYSLRGRITIAAVVWQKDDPGPTGWGWEPEFVPRFVPLDAPPLFEYHILANGIDARFPHWLPIPALATLSVAATLPWLRWRFSLRTLLIATTLVAAGLGFFIWAVR
jgi:hypothetical protein